MTPDGREKAYGGEQGKRNYIRIKDLITTFFDPRPCYGSERPTKAFGAVVGKATLSSN
jgi:hypothetical protein